LQEVSIGDYVISGGEVAAGVLIDAVSRKIPGVLGHEESAHSDSHAQGWLEAPLMTRPRVWQGQEVPEFLLSGHHEKIHQWRQALSVLVTIQKRPDLWAATREQHRSVGKPIDLSMIAFLWKKLSGDERRVLGLDPVQIEKALVK
jgi:tRNA (guanine37-N1)-methyltransferase